MIVIIIPYISGQLVNLTKAWKAAGSVYTKRTAKWLSQENVQEFLEVLSEKLKVPQKDLLVKVMGRHGGTYAH